MAYPTIQYNSATGSDTAPSDAVATSVSTSQTASGTSGASTITFSAAVDLSGCADDDSDYIRVDNASGDRKLFRITAFTTATDLTAVTAVTIDGTVQNTFSGVDWHVNGTRQTLQADTGEPDCYNWKRGWVVELNGSFTVSTAFNSCDVDSTTAAIDDPPFIMRASPSASSRPVITKTGSYIYRNNKPITHVVEGIKFEATAGNTFTFVDVDQGALTMIDCVVINTSGTQPSVLFEAEVRSLRLIDCYLKGGSQKVINSNNSTVVIDNCRIDCDDTYASTTAVDLGANRTGSVTNTLINKSVGDGITVDVGSFNGQQGLIFIKNCTISDCGGDGIEVSGTTSPTSNAWGARFLTNNLITNNGGWGVNWLSTTAPPEKGDVDFNCVFNNTSGGYNGVSPGENDVTITSDPFTDAANDDYTLNSSATGGALLKDAARYDLPDGT